MEIPFCKGFQDFGNLLWVQLQMKLANFEIPSDRKFEEGLL